MGMGVNREAPPRDDSVQASSPRGSDTSLLTLSGNVKTEIS